ncbi:PAS domain S-box protein [Acidobacteriota bacterium]
MPAIRSVHAITDLRPGDHACFFFETDEEQRAVLTPFLRTGLEHNEKVVYFAYPDRTDAILSFLREDGLEVESFLTSGQLSFLLPPEKKGKDFDPKELISNLSASIEMALSEGFTALRITSEGEGAFHLSKDLHRIYEYHTQLDTLVRTSQCLTCCQYDRRLFESEVLLDALKNHPYAIIGTEVINNFYYIPPQDRYTGDQPSVTLEHRVLQLVAHRKYEATLRESEERYRKLVQTSPDAVTVTDLDGRITDISQRTLDLHGIDHPDDVLGESCWDYFAPEDRERALANARKTVDEGYIENIQYTMLKKDGTPFPVELNASVLKDADGNPKAFIATERDTSARKEAEKALRESEARFRTAIENLPFDMFAIDKNGRYFMQNSTCKDHAGPIIGKRPEDVCPDKETLAIWLRNNRRAFNGEVVDEEVSFKAGGEVRLFRNIISPIYDGREIRGILGVNIDITDSKKAEDALKKSEERYRSFVQNFLGIAFRGDTSLIPLFFHGAVEEITGYRPEEFLAGKPRWDEVIHPEDLTWIIQDHTKTFEPLNTETQEREYRIIRKDGEVRWLHEILQNVKDPETDRLYVQGVEYDITARKQAEAKLLHYQDRLRSLASELSMTEERERRRIAAELHDRIGQVLAAAKIKLGAAQHSASSPDMVKNLEEIRAHIEQTIKDTRSLTFELSPPILYELGFEPAVEWMTEQVHSDHGIAITFTDTGGSKPLDHDIRIVLFYATREALFNVVKHAKTDHAEVTISKQDNDIQITITDDGIGFDPPSAGYQSDRTGGFGLFNIRERLDILGGSLEVSSTPGLGATVILTAPLKRESRDKEYRI